MSYYWLLWCKMHRPVCRLWLRNPSDGFLELGTNYKYCWFMLPSTIHTTVAHDSLVCKMALLIVWNNMGTDTFFRHLTNSRFKRLSMCISEGCRFQRTPEGRRGVTQSRPSSRTSSLKRKGNCHNLRNMLCQAFCTTIHCNIMTPFVGCWNKLGECFEIFYLSARILPLISTRFLLLLQLHTQEILIKKRTLCVAK